MHALSWLLGVVVESLSGPSEFLTARAAGALQLWILAGSVAVASALVAYGGWLATTATVDHSMGAAGFGRLHTWVRCFSWRCDQQYDQLDGLLAELVAEPESAAKTLGGG
jgi:hypothetical protein